MRKNGASLKQPQFAVNRPLTLTEPSAFLEKIAIFSAIKRLEDKMLNLAYLFIQTSRNRFSSMNYCRHTPTTSNELIEHETNWFLNCSSESAVSLSRFWATLKNKFSYKVAITTAAST
ncbi:hypothetical protein [Legionella impletisoli]|uniref:hypothetical protein n=1 Tax=Legionella impletisoli TaxID=343510 RepID=UPI0010411754|nr:hypothetical protein [Legionella impletisoli]